jgi:disulfide bond formation protein DsbB
MSEPMMATLFSILAVIANLAVIVAIVLSLGARFSERLRAARNSVWELVGETGIFQAWVVATVCTLGSLYFSEVAHFDPCRLCWYQRIAMYPLPVILGIALLRRDRGVRYYALALAFIGAAISVYHYQLERFPHQGGIACEVDNPCTVVWVWRFHFISIPWMALSGFAFIVTALLIVGRSDPTPWRVGDMSDPAGSV